MPIYQIILLALIQGAAELLPVSSSAHVIVAEKLMGIDPSTPEMTFLLVMLHTGTMFAVLLYFWKRWLKMGIFAKDTRTEWFKKLFLATIATGVVGFGLKFVIEHIFLKGESRAEIEVLFKNLPLIATALAAAGLLIFLSGSKKEGSRSIEMKDSLIIGVIQGICLPFRGFSRSGATISTALMTGISKATAEDFSFALAVILTPPVILRELKKMGHISIESLTPGLLGMVFSFASGLIALRLLSNTIENGKWKYFSYYCFAASLVIFGVHFSS